MTAINTNGCPSDTFNFSITANPLPSSIFTLSENEICGFADTIFTTNTSLGATDHFWNFDNGNTSMLFEPAIAFSDTGTYDISLITTNEFACQDTFTQSLNILGQPMADILVDHTEACQPAIFNFNNNAQYADGFEWNFGDGNINASIENPAHQYPQDGMYEVILTASNTNGCPSDQDTINLIVHPKPLSDFELSEDLICGLPDTIITSNFSEGANDYFWRFGNGQTSTLTAPSIVYQNPDDYDISLVVTSEFNCRDTMVQSVSVNLQPLASFEPGQYQGCEPDTVFFNNTTVNADSWFWDFGDGNTSDEFSPSHPYPLSGLFTVSMIAAYNETCFDTLEVINAVNILPSPTAAFSFIDMEDGQIQFNNESQEAIFYEWDFGNGDFSEAFSPFYEYNDNGNWQVILTAIHQNGCEDYDTLAVSPNIFFGLHVPNAMSPESGTGDVRIFKPAGIGIANYTVEVHAPWGQLLWKNSALDGEQPMGSWDGYFRGKLVPQGAYVWKAEVEYINGIRQVKTGTVSVLR